VLTVALVAVAAVAGVTGTWSPCGFSMIETIGRPRVHVLASCATFALGALAGGVATFAAIASAGAAVRGVAGGTVVLVAAGIAAAAAVAELRGAAIAPQIRRQVPERWRWTLPLPLATALYGVLLGLGFTTFVLTFAVWALAGVTFAAGDPGVAIAVGVAFGAGRALPIVAIAPLVHRPLGGRLLAVLAERPAMWRAFRTVDAAALVVAAAVLLVSRADAATNIGVGSDPSAFGDAVVWTTAAGGVEVRQGQAGTTSVPAHAVLGGLYIAWRDGETVQVANAADSTLTPVVSVTVPGVDALAVSDRWLVTRAPTSKGDALAARPLDAPTEVHPIASSRRPTQLGRPSIDGDVVVFHVATPHGSRIVEYDLAGSVTRVLRRSVSALLTNPALLGDRVLYVRQGDLAQQLELGPVRAGGRDRVLYRLAAPAQHDAGYEPGYSHQTRTPHPRTAQWTFWTTALSATHAYVTLVPRRSGAQPKIVSVSR
jgi:hypothetical protein